MTAWPLEQMIASATMSIQLLGQQAKQANDEIRKTRTEAEILASMLDGGGRSSVRDPRGGDGAARSSSADVPVAEAGRRIQGLGASASAKFLVEILQQSEIEEQQFWSDTETKVESTRRQSSSRKSKASRLLDELMIGAANSGNSWASEGFAFSEGWQRVTGDDGKEYWSMNGEPVLADGRTASGSRGAWNVNANNQPGKSGGFISDAVLFEFVKEFAETKREIDRTTGAGSPGAANRLNALREGLNRLEVWFNANFFDKGNIADLARELMKVQDEMTKAIDKGKKNTNRYSSSSGSSSSGYNTSNGYLP